MSSTSTYSWPERAPLRRPPLEDRREAARAEGRQLPTYAEAKRVGSNLAGPCAVWACTNETARPAGEPVPCRSCRLAFGSALTPVDVEPEHV